MFIFYHVHSACLLYILIVVVPSVSQETVYRGDMKVTHVNYSENSGLNNKLIEQKHASLPNSEPQHHGDDIDIKIISTTSIPSPNVTTIATDSTTTQNASISTSTSQTPTTGPTFLPITAPSDSNNTCQQLLEVYANLTSRFTECAIVHAKPFLFCENCVRQYVEAENRYKIITKHKCKDELLSSDRVMIVIQLHEFVIKLWGDGNCDTCFEDVNACQTNQTCSLSPVIRHFMDSYQDTMECFSHYKPPKQIGHHALLRDVCGNCSESYQILNEKYEDTGSLDQICMDVVELMNHTRIKWSREFKCIQFKKDEGSVLALGCFIGVLPLFFYCGVRVHAVKQKRRVMRQKRLSLAQSNIQYSSSS